MVVLVWFIDYLTGEEWSRQKRGCVDQEQPLSTVWRLVNYIYPDCYIVSWSQPGPGPGNTHNWKLDSYVDWLCERNQALVSWSWFRVCQEGENRECPVNKCITLNGLHQTSMSTSVNWSTWQFLHEMQVYNYTIHSLGGGGGILIHVFLSCIKCSWLKVHCWLLSRHRAVMILNWGCDHI